MVQICLPQHFLKIGHIWFADNDMDGKQPYDMCFFHDIPKLHDPNNRHEIHNTLVSTLMEPEDSLFGHIDKRFRSCIRKGTKDNLAHRVYRSAYILNSSGLLEAFACVYHHMLADKKLPGSLHTGELLAYARQNALLITTASLDGRELIYHSYVHDATNARCLHSCSDFRNVTDSGERNAYGMANKWLHWQDMLHFKGMGIESYDWGGVYSFDGTNGVDNFKLSFGGEPRRYYNEIVLCSLRGRALKTMADCARKALGRKKAAK